VRYTDNQYSTGVPAFRASRVVWVRGTEYDLFHGVCKSYEPSDALAVPQRAPSQYVNRMLFAR
jgi:hypothetical protein